jgi:DNA-directed RNA polymerase subunit RPC12/RpoP
MRDRRLSLEIHEVELRSLADVAERFGVYLECLRCGRLSALDARRLIARHAGDLTLYQLRRQARCSRCGGRRARVLLRRPAIRGDLAWLPGAPRGAGRD